MHRNEFTIFAALYIHWDFFFFNIYNTTKSILFIIFLFIYIFLCHQCLCVVYLFTFTWFRNLFFFVFFFLLRLFYLAISDIWKWNKTKDKRKKYGFDFLTLHFVVFCCFQHGLRFSLCRTMLRCVFTLALDSWKCCFNCLCSLNTWVWKWTQRDALVYFFSL